jgi:nucleoside-diphosphate-sugar epimerase
MQIQNIFLTGANGFIGSHVLEKLLNSNYKVAIFLRKESDTSRIHSLLKNNKLSVIYSDTLEDYFLKDTPDCIIHLATCYKKHHAPEDIQAMVEANIEFPTQLLQLCSDYKTPYFINTGTFFEYEFSSNEIITEQTLL